MAKTKETTSFNTSGGVTFVNSLSKPPEKIGFEKRFFPNLLMSSFLWGYAFDSEKKPIHTGSQGTVFIPLEVNRYYYYLRLESTLKEAFKRKASDVEILIITSTQTFYHSRRVNQLSYQILGSRQRMKTVLFESWIIIDNTKLSPKINVFTKEILPQKEWSRILK